MKKKKYKLRKWVKISILIVFTVVWYHPLDSADIYESVVDKKELSIREEEVIYTKERIEEEKDVEKESIIEEIEGPIEESVPEVEEIKVDQYETRMTSYYSNDGYETGTITGSGLGISDFQVNENGWYTYQDKLVVATATEYLLKYGFSLAEGVHTYQYYDEIILTIDGIEYQAIVLDSCGSSMKTGRIDLFVTDSNHVKDTNIIVKSVMK